MAFGVYNLLPNDSSASARLARFENDYREGRLTVFRLAHYEGELYADALTARSLRLLNGAAYVGLALGGGGVLALSALGDFDSKTRDNGYIAGALVVGLGGISSFITLRSRTPAELVWKRYRSGPIAGSSARLTLTPSLGAQGAGLVAAGSF
ncbi:MAG: hypothetical protein ACOY0T_12970 [Myxococcota bacterium]